MVGQTLLPPASRGQIVQEGRSLFLSCTCAVGPSAMEILEGLEASLVHDPGGIRAAELKMVCVQLRMKGRERITT